MYFEDFKKDRRIRIGERSVSAEDVDRFIELVELDNPIFMSDEGAGEAGHSRRLVPGPLQLSLAMGMCQQAGLFDRVVAVAQFERIRFKKPVHPGDTLTMEALPLEKRPTSNPRRGLVVLRYDLFNQHQEGVMSALGVYLFRTQNKVP